ncbi:squalene--hopene cyclase [Rubripirellula sp.]|nr:squalene--hopene cyclase [Rubripirellula sp.]MDB4633850.1 squalene--hopene cyclase [Rubripirellula sp.]MDB4654329.1 squalene--hopene cyclase [Rubripirellula sp.]
MIDQAPLWADPRLTYTVAALAVLLLLAAVWLFGRKKRQGRQAGVICLSISIALHLALIILVPKLPMFRGQATVPSDSATSTDESIASFQFFDPDAAFSSDNEEIETPMNPLPLSNLTDLLDPPRTQTTAVENAIAEDTDTSADAIQKSAAAESAPNSDTNPSPPLETLAIESLIPELLMTEAIPASTDSSSNEHEPSVAANMTSQLDSLLDSAFSANQSLTPPIPSSPSVATTQTTPAPAAETIPRRAAIATPSQLASAKISPLIASSQPTQNDFANRNGDAKIAALTQTGGSQETEAAVASALRFLAQTQQPNGSWNPQTTGAGVERAPLGVNRHGAGGRSETAITGLALLAMIGAGNTHHQGPYADHVYRGLAFLINSQSRAPQNMGSLAGPTTSVYSATYSHGIAALAMCEAAAITQDASALVSAQRAMAYTKQMQIPATGGWRYTRYDRDGDLSQLGWQAMVLDAGHRAKLPVNAQAVKGIQRFLRSVRAGRGGLASYRPREAPTRTMTAEALATRLLIGETVPKTEINEAERSLMQQLPGIGVDNYYYWYYATLALHQLQDDAWNQWNDALQRRLLSTQQPDGSWSSNTVWGGYGGEIYTTSMAALCLETYYRHAIRKNKARIATRPATQKFQR